MSKTGLGNGRPALILALIFLVVISSSVLAKTTRVVFENGMEVIFKENHSSPMIASIVFVRAGAKYETEFNNGSTHFLEHLLFDGTQNHSREEISAGIQAHGGYINAFTRKDLTGYLVLMPVEHIEYGLEIQADQLFNSIFPEEELPKERKVVIEEIQKDNDNEANQAYYFFSAKSMAGTGYERPVLGYKNIIASIPLENIIEYWKQYYAPNNMVALVIGDFETEEMIELFRSIFGVIPPVDLPSPPAIGYFPPTGREVFRKAGQTKMTYLHLGIDAPHFTDPDYFAFDLMADYLNSNEISPLASTLVDSSGSPLYQSFSVELETAEEFSRLIVSAVTDDVAKAELMVAGIDTVLSHFQEFQPSPEVLHGLRVSKKANEIYLEEKLHYYGFMIAPRLVITGWDFMESYLNAIDKVNPTIMARAADRWMKDLKYTATVYYPKKETSPGEGEATYTTYRRGVLPNGLTLVVKSNSDSRVFALNVIGKNRSASEPPGKTGITDFVNKMIEKGTTSLNAKDLSQELAYIGAKVTVGDMPWISHDDFYTTRQYAFLKFETIDEYTEEGLAIFADMIKNPAFDSAEVEDTRRMLMGILGRQSGSTLDVCRDLFYETLFENHPYAKSINGSQRSVGMITRDDLVDFHHKFYSPGNLIITVGTNYDADTMMAMLTETFGGMPSVDFSHPASVPEGRIKGIRGAHHEMDKEQVYIFLGGFLAGANDADAVAIRVAAEVLSDRLQLNLREKQGLAYSVGAGANFDPEFGWYICSIGTGFQNFETARDGILAEIEKLKDGGPSSEELETAKNSLWGRTLTRRLSRINQAYYMGVNEYLGLGYDYEKRFVPAMQALTVDDIKAAAQKYFDTDNYVIATVGKK